MRRIVAALAAVAALSLAVLFWTRPDQRLPERPLAQRPPLLLLTSLPLLFGERFGLDRPASPALARLEQRYRVIPIAVADAPSLAGHTLLLMAQPRAQPAEALVALDQWVRLGGRLVLLADPRLDWPSARALGDVTRPPLTFPDTGLLDHWGLTLDPPAAQSSAGSLVARSPECKAEQAGRLAHCRIGRGAVTVIADADFLNASDPKDSALDPLMRQLAAAESR